MLSEPPGKEIFLSESRVAEVEDDYGTNPTHEPTETRCFGYGYKGCTKRDKRN